MVTAADLRAEGKMGIFTELGRIICHIHVGIKSTFILTVVI